MVEKVLRVLLFLVGIAMLSECVRVNAAPAVKPRVVEIDSTRLVRIDHPIDGRSLDRANEITNMMLIQLKPIDIIITSPGGSVNLGNQIIAAMEEAKFLGVKIRCFVPAFAASMGSNILLHCSERYALPTAEILFHEVAVSRMNQRMTATNLAALAQELKAIDVELLAYMHKATGIPLEALIPVYVADGFHSAQFWNDLGNDKDEPWITIVDVMVGAKELRQYENTTDDKRLKTILRLPDRETSPHSSLSYEGRAVGMEAKIGGEKILLVAVITSQKGNSCRYQGKGYNKQGESYVVSGETRCSDFYVVTFDD